MADGFQRLIKLLRQNYPEVQGRGTGLWGAKETGHRDNIRSSINEILKPESPSGVADLAQVPRPAKWSVSISHTALFGGWLAVPLPARVGFDIEDGSRIRMDVIRRMSTPDEIGACPDPAFLWCAKEAYFKSLAQDQPQAITQLGITGWQQIEDDAYSFIASPHKMGQGWIIKSSPLIYGACLV